MLFVVLVFFLASVANFARAQDAPDGAPAAAAEAPAAPAKESAPAAPVAAAANEPPDPRANIPVFKIWERAEDMGNRYLKVGNDHVPVDQLHEILNTDKDPEVQKRLKSYRVWNTVRTGATVASIATGAFAFISWRSSVSNHESSSSIAPLLFGAALAMGGLYVYADHSAEQALYRAQAVHNNRILQRQVAPPASPTTLRPQSPDLGLAMEFHFD